ncbi:hypothetical protein DENSPDRAFT_833424 [Dentipellis sp. KUC8613]|nr:hypothetical protein DENSPDRAFT_833424 [Dentipellis sp. KUC8613]
MQFFTSTLVAITLALSATAVTNPSISRAVHERRCEDSVDSAAASPVAVVNAVASPAAVVDAAAPAGFLAGTQTGQGTYYATGLGSCGIVNNDSDYIVAVSHLLYDSYPGAGANPNANPVCNKRIQAHYQGKSVTVTVTDRCEACKMTDLDFSPAAFSQLASESIGRLNGVTWNWA